MENTVFERNYEIAEKDDRARAVSVSYTHLFTDCVFELLEVWTIEGNAAITIVNERLTDNFQIGMPRNVVLANGSLACNGVAFNFVPVFTGQAAVNCRPVNFSGHKNNPVSYTHLCS